MKNLKELGQALSKAEQKTIDGGKVRPIGDFDGDCDSEIESLKRCSEGSRECGTNAICNEERYCECTI